jgi:hypothetical protein
VDVDDGVEVVTSGDVSWMADVMVERRALYATFSPLFWRPAANARAIHEPHVRAALS